MRVARRDKFFQRFKRQSLKIFLFFFQRPLQGKTANKFALLRRDFNRVEVKTLLIGIVRHALARLESGAGCPAQFLHLNGRCGASPFARVELAVAGDLFAEQFRQGGK